MHFTCCCFYHIRNFFVFTYQLLQDNNYKKCGLYLTMNNLISRWEELIHEKGVNAVMSAIYFGIDVDIQEGFKNEWIEGEEWWNPEEITPS